MDRYPAFTKGDLKPALILEVDEKGVPCGESIPCMFNPFEYTISKSNTYHETSGAGSSTPNMELEKSGAQTLKLKLVFDTYETGEDVSLITRRLWKLMTPRQGAETKQGNKTKQAAPYVAFNWGAFHFVSLITNMTHKFNLFDLNGLPLRATVDITFTQHHDQEDYQNPTSGGTPIDRVWTVTAGDRLDLIAAEVYGDETLWPKIAAHNGIVNPFRLFPGRQLFIPLEQDV